MSAVRLEIFYLDPEDEYRLVRTATLAWDDVDETELHKTAMLCDGDRLVTLMHKDSGVVKRTAGELLGETHSLVCARACVRSHGALVPAVVCCRDE